MITTDRRVAVIGDVGGHLEELRRELRRLGVDPTTGRLPDDLVVVQVGDLVHRGPDSPGVVALVDRYLREQPEQWVQLAGNHEAQYLRPPAFDWWETLPEGSADTVRRWWGEGMMRVAAAVRTPSESFLITHAGLTRGFWLDMLGAPDDAEQTAALLNDLAGQDVVFRPGQMLGGGAADLGAGPLWASAGELLASWLDLALPFSLVHGHSSIAPRLSVFPPDVVAATTVDRAQGHEQTRLPGGRIVGVDPGHGRAARVSWRSWVITSSSREGGTR